MKKVTAALAVILALCVAAGEKPFRIPRRRKGTVSDPGSVFTELEDARLREQRDVTLRAGDTSHVVRYEKHLLPAASRPVETDAWPLGLVGAAQSAWPADGFLGVEVDGERIGGARLAHLGVIENRDRALYDFVFELDGAWVRTRFAVVPRSPPLHLEVLLDPKQRITDFRVRLRAAMAGSGVGDPPARARVTTRERRGAPVPAKLDPDGEHWILLSNRQNPVSNTDQPRACAAFWLPQHVGRAQCLDAGDGHTTVELAGRPGLKRMRMSLLELRDDDPPPTPDGLAPVFAEAARLLEGPAFEDGVPDTFPAAESRTEIGTLLAQLKDRGDFASRVTDIRERIGREIAALAGGGATAWVAQHRLSAYVTCHTDLLWDLRFAVLEQ